MKSKETSSKRSLKETAYLLLSRKAYSTQQLRRKLREKDFGAQEIEKLIEELIQLGYLNDADWIRAYIRRQIRQKYGQQVIRQKLVQEGFSAADFERQLEEELAGPEAEQSIRRLLETRYRSRKLSDPKERQKLIAALLRRGHDYAAIRAALEVDLDQEDASDFSELL